MRAIARAALLTASLWVMLGIAGLEGVRAAEVAGGMPQPGEVGSKNVAEVVAWAMVALIVGLFLGRRGSRHDRET